MKSVRVCPFCLGVDMRNGYHKLCTKHQRFQQMRQSAREDNKYVPSITELDALLEHILGMQCPVCSAVMNWLSPTGYKKRTITLQHDKDGGIRLICFSCNSKHRNFPGDLFYSVPNGHKYCTGCSTIKPFCSFSKNQHKLRSKCKLCRKPQMRKWYELNRAYVLERSAIRYQQIKQWKLEART